MVLARPAKRAPRQIADLIVKNFPALDEGERLEVAGPDSSTCSCRRRGAHARCARFWRRAPRTGAPETRPAARPSRVRLGESDGPVGDRQRPRRRRRGLAARLLRSQGVQVTTEFYVNDAGNQFEALAPLAGGARAPGAREPAALPENGYPGEYLVDLAKEYRAGGGLVPATSERERVEHFGRYAVTRIVEAQRKVLLDYGVEFDVWSLRAARRPRQGPAGEGPGGVRVARLSYAADGALWFRSTALGTTRIESCASRTAS